MLSNHLFFLYNLPDFPIRSSLDLSNDSTSVLLAHSIFEVHMKDIDSHLRSDFTRNFGLLDYLLGRLALGYFSVNSLLDSMLHYFLNLLLIVLNQLMDLVLSHRLDRSLHLSHMA